MPLSRKKRKEFSHLLPPTVFLSAISQHLRIIPEVRFGNKLSSPSSVPSRKDNTPQQQHSSEVVFTNETIEALRRCHGEFIALVASDLASRNHADFQIQQQQKERAASAKRRRGKRIQKLPEGSKNEDDNDNADNKTDKRNGVQVVTPKEVLATLNNLEFQDIVLETSSSCSSELAEIPRNDTMSSTTIPTRISKKSGIFSSCYPITKMNDGPGSKRIKSKNSKDQRRKKFKTAYKDNKVTIDLAKEQERLLASCVARARMDRPLS